MTGHGEAHLRQDGLSVSVEVRSVNNRYFKLVLRASEGYSALESQIEELVRKSVRRGSVQVNLRIDRQARSDDYRVNTAVLSGYVRQLRQALAEQHEGSVTAREIRYESLLDLPGVIGSPEVGWEQVESLWPLIQQTLQDALARFTQMRQEEGRAMARDLSENLQAVQILLGEIEARAPQVVEAYRNRLLDRLNLLLKDLGVNAEPRDIIREVGVFAERSDISEEIVRLRSHLQQFAAFMAEAESSGRKLDFLTQEIFRETNTIGSKAGDAEIARRVVEIKSAIERVREMIQNLE
jgi:uncharacterized protein (TIGR00255 family)